jgi:uncharacterized membrane protein YeaQ/YmgE (transglycosylase-associated protein family)
MFFIILVVVGGVVGWLVSSLTEGRGLGMAGNVSVGIVGALFVGILFARIGARLVGEGPLFFASVLAGAVGAAVLILLVRLVKR